MITYPESMTRDAFDKAMSLLRAMQPCTRGQIERELLVQGPADNKATARILADQFITDGIARGLLESEMLQADKTETPFESIDLTQAGWDFDPDEPIPLGWDKIDGDALEANVSPEALSASRAIMDLSGLLPVRNGHWTADYTLEHFIVHMARVIDREIRR